MSKNNLMKTIKIPTDLHKRLKIISAMTGDTLEDLVKEILDSGLKSYEDGK